MENQIAPSAAINSVTSPVDGHGHDPSHYDWVPVLKKRRVDGWSPEKQRGFIEALADTGSVMQAAAAVGMSERSAYSLRRAPGSQGFDRAWAVATEAAGKRLLDEAFERALVGSDEPVFNRDGDRVGRRFRKSDGMLQFLLRGYFPERFGALIQSAPNLDQSASPTVLAEAIEQMLPEMPDEPHQLMSPERLDDAYEIADMASGGLPHWLREREQAVEAARSPVDDMLDAVRRDNAYMQTKNGAKKPPTG